MTADIFTSSVRGASPEIALERVVSFAQQFGENHFVLASHAAFPLAITPDLLYQIWANFVPFAPWTAVADILLSNLCSEVGYGLYEMDISVRNLLIKQLKEDNRYGRNRLEELAGFLIEQTSYEQELSNDNESRMLAKTQKWTALAYTKPNEAARELALELRNTLDYGPNSFRLVSFVESLAEPLKEFFPLISYARGIRNFMQGDIDTASHQLNTLIKSNGEIKSLGIQLPIPDLRGQLDEKKVKSQNPQSQNFGNFNLSQFVDRKEELSQLIKKISYLSDKNNEEMPSDYERVVHLVGKSGVGKSFLLFKYQDYILKNGIAHPLFLSLKPFLIPSGEEFIVRVLDFLYSNIAFVLGKQPIKKFQGSVNDLSSALHYELDILQRKDKVVFLIDDVNILSNDQIQVLEDYFLAHSLLLPRTVLILSGRHLVTGWKDFALRPYIGGDKENVIELSGFGFEYTQKQIQAINPNIDDLVATIHEISGGSPGNNRRIVEQIGDFRQFNELEAIRICNQGFYEAIAEAALGLPESTANDLLLTLESLCVLQDFDKEYEMPVMLSTHPALNGTWTVQRCADLLNILSKVQVGPGRLVDWDMQKSALTLEEQTRFNLEKELKIRDINLWKKLHCTAMKMYSEWADQYGMDSIFADKSEYHKVQLMNARIDPKTCG